MTYAPYCASCGAANQGTAFCESCGARAVEVSSPATVAPQVRAAHGSTVAVAEAVAPPAPAMTMAGAGWIPPRHVEPIAIVALLGAQTLPYLYTAVAGDIDRSLLAATWMFPLTLGIVLCLVFVAAFAVLLGRSPEAPGAKVGASLLVFPGVALAFLNSGGAYGYAAGLVDMMVATAVATSMIFVGWAVVRGLRARTYWALLLLIATVVAGFVIEIPITTSWIGSAAAYCVVLVAGTAGALVAALRWDRRARIEKPASLVRYQPSYSAPAVVPAATATRPAVAATGDPSAALRTNSVAVLALIFGILGSGLLPVILGHVALGQIDRSGERGRGMAITGLVFGYLVLGSGFVVLGVFAVIALVFGAR